MARSLSETGVHGYDDETDLWWSFNTPEEAQAWLAEFEATPDYGIHNETRIISVAPAFNAFSLGITTPGGTTFGPVVQLLQADEGRLRAVIGSVLPAGTYLLLGTREGINAGQGFPLIGTQTLEIKNTRALWAALAQGSAAGAQVGTVGVFTESLAG